jgi:hypothetical protein
MVLGTSGLSEGSAEVQSVKSSGNEWGVLALNPNGGNVGVGTAAPRGRMEITGNGASVVIGDPNCGAGSSTVAIGFLSGQSLNCSSNFNLGASTTLKETVINAPLGGRISARLGNASDIMTIVNGKVGIGNTNPQTALHVEAPGDGTYAVFAKTDGSFSTALHGQSDLGYGVYGHSSSFEGVRGISGSGIGVYGESGIYRGVAGDSITGDGVYGTSSSGHGISGLTTGGGSGVYGSNLNSNTVGHAGYFSGRVGITGNLTVDGVFSNPSDVRLKQQVTPLVYGLLDLLQLRPVTWKWKTQPGGPLQLGLIAQDVEGVLPELVQRDADPDTPLGLNYLGLIPVTIKAIQDQQEQFKQQEERISKQEEELQRQQRQIDVLKALVCSNLEARGDCER